MSEDAPPKSELAVDDVYLRVLEMQQEWASTRWGIMTFFLSVSFAIFGFSFGVAGNSCSACPPTPVINATMQRVSGLAIYWFSYLLFRRYEDWSQFLRGYLYELEHTRTTQFKLQTMWKASVQKGFRRWTSVNKLLIYFGIVYSISVVLLYFLKI